MSDTVKGVSHRVYKKDGKAVVETYLVPGMGHGTPVDPGSAEDACGQAGAYILDVNICSSYHLGRFWGIVAAAGQGGGDGGGDEWGWRRCGELLERDQRRALRSGAGRSETVSYRGRTTPPRDRTRGSGYANTLTRLEETRVGYFVKVTAC